MSRAPGASFAQFFPSAPRAAKDKAKEREKFKSQGIDSPSIRPVADTKSVASNSRFDDGGSSRGGGESMFSAPDAAAPQAEDNESLQGDLLNGVGSASSHTSAVSSVFSAPAQQPNISTFGASRNVNSLTPLTNVDSSPSRVTSPNQYKVGAPAINSTWSSAEKAAGQEDTLQAQPAVADQLPQEPRVFARDPNKGVKGMICTYDPLLDRKLSSNEKKKAKPIYKEFGLVRILQSLGSVILLVRMSG
jgi:[histone H3]-lysine4 N-trimethyltransferase SETD1